MSFAAWIEAATRGLPAAARRRLESEYRDHWEASEAERPGGLSALELFGPPLAVRWELRRLYLSQRQLAWRKGGYSVGMVVNLLGVIAVFALTLCASAARVEFWTVIAFPALAATLFGLAWLMTLKLERFQRSFAMDVVCVLLSFALPTLLVLSSWPAQQRLPWLLTPGWPAALLGAGLLGLGAMVWHEHKFRRTLRLEGAAD